MELSEQQEQQPNPAAAVMETEETSSAEVFYHPETGERISKNAYKKLLKGKVQLASLSYLPLVFSIHIAIYIGIIMVGGEILMLYQSFNKSINR